MILGIFRFIYTYKYQLFLGDSIVFFSLPVLSYFSISNMYFLCSKNANKIIYIYIYSKLYLKMIYLGPKCEDLMPFFFKYHQNISEVFW